MALLFGATLFASALLLFWVQPLVGKALLPLLGGTPAVWNTCLLFFQTLLLAGYAYVLLATRLLNARAQVALHLALLVSAAVALPLALPLGSTSEVPAEGSPVGWLLTALLLTVGPPFFILSATAPLLQKWYTRTRARSAGDPYFLYAASNAGSLFALLGFPLLFEPFMSLARQSAFWSAGYLLLALFILACGASALRARRREPSGEGGGASGLEEIERESDAENLTLRRRLRWILLAFVPSSLVLGATTYITTDVASAPLLWVVPLSLYLASFIVVFARRTALSWRTMARLLPGAGVLLALIYLSGATEPAWFLIFFHLAFLFVASTVCHGQLADDRPGASRLAEFYLLIALGGALGGLFNAIVAPLVFTSVVEYPLVIVLASYLRPAFRASGFRLPFLRLRTESNPSIAGGAAAAAEDESAAFEEARPSVRGLVRPLGLGALTLALAAVSVALELEGAEKVALVLGVPLILLNHLFAHLPLRFAVGLGAVMLAGSFVGGRTGETVYAERNFYGTIRVSLAETGETLRLYHGSTLHGRQYTDAARACEPLSYYHRRGPLGAVFAAFDERRDGATARVAVVGLGAGTSAAYARSGQHWTFYEIDPSIARVASDPHYFSYLSDCARAPFDVVLGDARLKMREASDRGFDLIVLDAFSSDAVPAHLLTREALDLYTSKLAEGGMIVFHTSNRSLDLERVVGGVARDAGLVARVFADTKYEPDAGKEPSEWVAVARRAEDLGPLATDARWKSLEGGERLEVWRDDFSNIVSVFKWL